MDRSETLNIFYKQIRVNGKDFFRVEGLALLKIEYEPNLFKIVPLYNCIIYYIKYFMKIAFNRFNDLESQ